MAQLLGRLRIKSRGQMRRLGLARQRGGSGVSVRVPNQGQARGQIDKDPCKHYVATLGHC